MRKAIRVLKYFKCELLFVAFLIASIFAINFAMQRYNASLELCTYLEEGESLQCESYTVHYGDTLTSIAEYEQVRHEAMTDIPVQTIIYNIRRLNSIYDSKKLQSGALIEIPYIE